MSLDGPQDMPDADGYREVEPDDFDGYRAEQSGAADDTRPVSFRRFAFWVLVAAALLALCAASLRMAGYI